ncbi:MAG: hypothetical protein HYU41_20220 [Candidatus Rokubacteria bacterium]|nr:hypothetical protein [Candidatus Rokubacteria bacterium]
MPSFTVQEIIRATRGALVSGDLGVLVTGVSIDSRTLAVGEAFFAIHGHRLCMPCRTTCRPACRS